jgi:hypothetical protein
MVYMYNRRTKAKRPIVVYRHRLEEYIKFIVKKMSERFWREWNWFKRRGIGLSRDSKSVSDLVRILHRESVTLWNCIDRLMFTTFEILPWGLA